MEHTKRNEATKHSKRAEHYRQKNYIWIILLKWKKHKSHQGAHAMCAGVIMNRTALSALPLPCWVESSPSCVILQKSWEPATVPVLLLSPAQSCPIQPCPLRSCPALHSVADYFLPLLLRFPTHSISYLWICFRLCFCLRLQASWRPLCLCTFLLCPGLKILPSSRYTVYLYT